MFAMIVSHDTHILIMYDSLQKPVHDLKYD
jgi:hypothetical protein